MNELAQYDEPGRDIERAPTTVPATRSQLETMVIVARGMPRDPRAVAKRITDMATFDEETAEDCLYALVRKKKKGAKDEDNKPIEGPSIRLAEIAFQLFGNCIVEARTTEINRVEKYVEAEGLFHDLETNMVSKATTRRRISTSSGYLYSDDMINVTANAACAIAKRNAILAGIPRPVYRAAYLAARQMVAGDAKSLGVNRDKAVRAFAAFGVTPAQLLENLGLEAESDITLDHLVTLRGMFASLKNKETTVEEMFAKDQSERGKPDPTKNPLVDDKKPAEAKSTETEDDKPDPEAERAGAQAFVDDEPRKAPEDFSIAQCKSFLKGWDNAKAAADAEKASK